MNEFYLALQISYFIAVIIATILLLGWSMAPLVRQISNIIPAKDEWKEVKVKKQTVGFFTIDINMPGVNWSIGNSTVLDIELKGKLAPGSCVVFSAINVGGELEGRTFVYFVKHSFYNRLRNTSMVCLVSQAERLE